MTAATETKGDRTLPPAINDEQKSAAKDGSYHDVLLEEGEFFLLFDWYPFAYAFTLDTEPESLDHLKDRLPLTIKLFLEEEWGTLEDYWKHTVEAVQKGQKEGVSRGTINYPTNTPTAEKWKQAARTRIDEKAWAAESCKGEEAERWKRELMEDLADFKARSVDREAVAK